MSMTEASKSWWLNIHFISKGAHKEEKSDNNTRSIKVENSSLLYDIIVYSGTLLLDKYLSKKSVYQETLEQYFHIEAILTIAKVIYYKQSALQGWQGSQRGRQLISLS